MQQKLAQLTSENYVLALQRFIYNLAHSRCLHIKEKTMIMYEIVTQTMYCLLVDGAKRALVLPE